VRYQSFPDKEGGSASVLKLARLQLPQMAGKSFLDIGCNEGFFCKAAQDLGATRIIGIDASREAIDQAKERFPEIDFRAQTWDTLPDGKFDVILHASALHYATDPYVHIRRIRDALTDDGVFILECGVSNLLGQLWEKAERPVGSVYYATDELLRNDLLTDFSVRYVGDSVNQAGDPLPRKVYHCRKFKPIVLMITGRGGSGKTTFAGELARAGVPVFGSDYFLEILSRNAGRNTGGLWQSVQTKLNKSDAQPFYHLVNDTDLRAAYVTEVISAIPRGQRIVALEGYAFGLDKIQAHLIAELQKQGFFVHVSGAAAR
jgi:ubiquinone/menaquinone biosynthesis C-methylase UbiE